MFKTPYPIDTGKAERKNKERQLRIENQKLKEQRKVEAEEAAERASRDAERIQQDAERMRKDAEVLEANELTIQDLQSRLGDYEKRVRVRDQEIASLQGACGGPQEETWRKHVKINETQTLQLESNYEFKMVFGILQHPLYLRLKQDLGSWHPKESDLCLEWTFKGKWASIPKDQYNTNKVYFNYWIVRIEPYVTPNGELKRAFSYGDSNLNITIWYKVEEFQDVVIWEIPDQSPWANTKVWSRDSLANPNSNAARSRPPAEYTISNNYRGSAPRGRNTRGRPPIQRGSGRVGRNYTNYQGYREDTNYYNYDWQGSPERHSSGAGRSSRGARRDSTERHKERPGHRDSRDGIRESRANSQERSSHREAREGGARGSRANSPKRSGHR